MISIAAEYVAFTLGQQHMEHVFFVFRPKDMVYSTPESPDEHGSYINFTCLTPKANTGQTFLSRTRRTDTVYRCFVSRPKDEHGAWAPCLSPQKNKTKQKQKTTTTTEPDRT